jgi:hypothetical protein
MRDAQSEAAAQLLLDRFELLRLRTLLVGALGIIGLVVSLVALFGFGSKIFGLIGQALAANSQGIHVPSNLFQAPVDSSWARSPVLLQLAFVAIGIGGIAFMTRQVLSTVQVRLWLVVLGGLALCIVYMQSDVGSVWHAKQRDLVKSIRAKEWGRVEELSSASSNVVGHRYVMAQIGLVKPDAELVRLHGKVLVDQLDDSMLRRVPNEAGSDSSLLTAAEPFKPQILKAIDVAVYGAAHTQIGLSLMQSDSSEKYGHAGVGWALARSVVVVITALLGIGLAFTLLRLWRRMVHRLRRLQPWVVAAL